MKLLAGERQDPSPSGLFEHFCAMPCRAMPFKMAVGMERNMESMFESKTLNLFRFEC